MNLRNDDGRTRKAVKRDQTTRSPKLPQEKHPIRGNTSEAEAGES